MGIWIQDIWKPVRFSNGLLASSVLRIFFTYKMDQAKGLAAYLFLDHLKTRLRSTIRKPDMCSFRISTVSGIYVTSFSSILYWSNIEYWTKKHTQSGNIHYYQQALHCPTTHCTWLPSYPGNKVEGNSNGSRVEHGYQPPTTKLALQNPSSHNHTRNV